jgi:hypothetical protein
VQGPKYLIESEDHWVTNMGAWFPGERVIFRGKDLFHELNDLSWMGLLLYGITGRIFNKKQIRLFEGIWTLCTSYPDPRLWNNRVAALAGTARSTATLAISAANAASEASIYGYRPILQVSDFLFRIQQCLEKGDELEELVQAELKKYKIIPGYGRPITRKDERIEPLMALAKKLGFSKGPYVKLAFDVEKILLDGRWRLHMNIASVMAALAADQGLSCREYYHYAILSFSAGMLPCYIEALEKTEGTFFPLNCDRIQYEGKPRRAW